MSTRLNMAKWSPDSWRAKPRSADAGLSGREGARRGRGAACDLSAAGLCRRGAQPEKGAGAGRGRRSMFLLQGGDCAESFAEHGANNIRDFFRLFLQMAVVLTYAAASPVVKVGRIAGQFAKPRTSPIEKRDGVELPVYRGDIINGTEFTPEARTPDPRRQLEAYRQSAATLNLLRAFATGGYANLSNAHQWMLELRQGLAAIEALSGARRPPHRGARLHARLRHRSGSASGNAHDRFLHQPRGAAARLRAGLHARRFDDRRLVLHLRPHGVDRRPHPPGRSRPCRILPRHQESARPENRAVAEAGRAVAASWTFSIRTTSPAG